MTTNICQMTTNIWRMMRTCERTNGVFSCIFAIFGVSSLKNACSA